MSTCAEPGSKGVSDPHFDRDASGERVVGDLPKIPLREVVATINVEEDVATPQEKERSRLPRIYPNLWRRTLRPPRQDPAPVSAPVPSGPFSAFPRSESVDDSASTAAKAAGAPASGPAQAHSKPSYLSMICSPRKRTIPEYESTEGEPDYASTRFTIFGGGSFGTALAWLLARKGINVKMLVRSPEVSRCINEEHRNPHYLSEFALPDNLTATIDPEEALHNTNYIIHAIPVQHSADYLHQLAPLIPFDVPLLSTSKGINVQTLELMSDIIPRALGRPDHPTAFLSGPSFAREVIQSLPTAVVVASKERALAKRLQTFLHSPTFRVYLSTDVIGVEAGGALKNVLAIGAGALQGLELGSNAMASLVTRGISEIRKLAVATGGRASTISGLAGVGDITLTCLGALSRNRQVGERLGRGETLESIISSMNGEVAEGIFTASAVVEVARKHRLHLPILFTVANIINGKIRPEDAEREILTLPMPQEDEDMI